MTDMVHQGPQSKETERRYIGKKKKLEAFKYDRWNPGEDVWGSWEGNWQVREPCLRW